MLIYTILTSNVTLTGEKFIACILTNLSNHQEEVPIIDSAGEKDHQILR